ncbi:hypothetical protein PM082_017080 [Marasmius tenuissimus]|nr:hypothetical protein PM082_017080 [Marasmius tenuissimus]
MTLFYVAYPILVQHGWINVKRQPSVLIARVGQVLGLGVTMVLWFAPVGREYVDATINLPGVIQKIMPLYFVGMLQNVAAYPTE